MKLLVTSDIHVDFKRSSRSQLSWSAADGVDGVVVAGDVANRTEFVASYMRELVATAKKPVYWVAGNHDYWDHDHAKHHPTSLSQDKHTIESTQNVLSTIPGFMNRTITQVGDERILGCTLWYYTPGKQAWSDHHYVSDWWNIETEALADAEFLKQNLRKGDIVVTHMMPSYSLVDPMYARSPDNKYYVHDLHDLILRREPKLWVSGHTHTKFAKMIGETLCVCNPRGYPIENPNYSHLIVDTSLIGSSGAITDVGWYDTHGR